MSLRLLATERRTIGTGSVAKAAPDGQTLILAAASHTITGSLYTKLAYDPLKDFTPIAHIGNVDYVLMSSSTIPPRTVAEFVAYGKANPGKLNYATAGNGWLPWASWLSPLVGFALWPWLFLLLDALRLRRPERNG